MSILLGIAAAITIGLSDAFGRASSRRGQSSATHVITQMLVGTIVALPFTLVVDSQLITRDLIFGALSGVFVALGLAAIYRAMADSSAAVTVPLAGVLAILLPLIWDLASGARLSSTAAVGSAVALVSLIFVSFDGTMDTSTLSRGLMLAVFGGFLFGLTFLFAGSTSPESGAWPAVMNRGFGLVGILAVARAEGAQLTLAPSVRKFGIFGGIAGAIGMVAVIVGAQVGSLGIVSVLAGSSPAVTVVATSVFDEDRVSRLQGLGIVGAMTGTALIALG